MAKTIKNKVYNEFWEDNNLDIKKFEDDKDSKSNVPAEEIKKLEKKLTKKVSVLHKEIKELKDGKIIDEIKPVNTPRGWHAKNSFVDDIENEFSKGVYVGKVDIVEEPVIEIVEEVTEIIEEIIEIIEEPVIEEPVIEEPVIEEVIEIVEEPVIEESPIVISDKDIYQQYIIDDTPFKIYFRGNLLFDSKVQPQKNYPIFLNDEFILFGKNYIYRGIRIEKY